MKKLYKVHDFDVVKAEILQMVYGSDWMKVTPENEDTLIYDLHDWMKCQLSANRALRRNMPETGQ